MKISKFICSAFLICTMLVANAAWTISPVSGKRYTHIVSDGTWTIGCDMIGTEGNFTLGSLGNKIQCVVAGAGNSLDLSTINTDLDTDETDYTLTEIAACTFEGVAIVDIYIPKTVTQILDHSFKNTVSGNVTFEEGSELTYIAREAFYKSSLQTINLDVCTKLETISGDVLRDCSKLTSIGSGYFPSLKSLGSHFIPGCANVVCDIVCPELIEMTGTDHFKKTGITSFYAPKLTKVPGYSFEESKIVSFTVSPDVVSFGPFAFKKCSSLIEFSPVSFPKLESVDSFCFDSCSALAGIFVGELPNLTFLGSHAFANTSALNCEFNAPSYTNGSSADYLFENSAVVKVVMPKLVTPASAMFYKAQKLEELVLSEDIKYFSDSFLQTTPKLVKVSPTTFPNVEYVGANALNSASALEGDFSFPIANRVGDHAFCNTKAIDSIGLDAVIKLDNNYNFENSSATNISLKSVMNISYAAFNGCKSLKQLTLNAGITNIAGRAFYNCQFENMTPTRFPNLKYLGEEAFSGASKYPGTIDISKSTNLTEILHHVFAACNNATEIKLPATIEKIHIYSFEKLYSANVYFYGPRPTFIGTGVFKTDKYERKANIIVMPEYVESWTSEEPNGYCTFTPLDEVPASMLSHQYPTTGKVLGIINFKTGDDSTHWLSQFVPITTTIIIR
ncbi:MAG: leucine-rich repeat protein [Kiritimatiellae bacterium]|nr:leucine-rich repeat protein [Kiritimatiellia bacterium]